MTFSVRLADTDELKEKAFFIRNEVFVLEQQVDAREEFDDHERESRHFVALDAQEQPIGAARWRNTPHGIKLERFSVKKSQRKKGVGSGLVQAVLKDISAQIDKEYPLYLHSQVQAVPLYRKFGFTPEGDMFLECNIEHYLMRRLIKPVSAFR